MDARYLRNLSALSEEECRLLRTKRILVVGCGGLGGYIIEMLARIGVGAIRAVDGDSFDETNLNRQLLSLPKVLGQSKAQVAAMRIAEVNPEVEAEAYYAFFDETNAEKLISGCDLVMDALDNIESRRILAAWCEKFGVPLVYGAISGWVAQAAVSLPGDNFIEKLYPSGVEINDKSALAFTPALCAAMQCALATRLLCGREIKSSSLKYFDLLNMEFETIDMV
jgi:molybdopterin/thiamine biosynthesis adenylyltransferase